MCSTIEVTLLRYLSSSVTVQVYSIATAILQQMFTVVLPNHYRSKETFEPVTQKMR